MCVTSKISSTKSDSGDWRDEEEDPYEEEEELDDEEEEEDKF
jgi:hypothetical protein